MSKRLSYLAERIGLEVDELKRRLSLAELTEVDLLTMGVPKQHLAELTEELAYHPINTPMMTKYAGLLEDLRVSKALPRVCRQIGLKAKELLEVMEVLELSLSHVEARLAEYKERGWATYRLGVDLLGAAFDPEYEAPTVRDGWAELGIEEGDSEEQE